MAEQPPIGPPKTFKDLPLLLEEQRPWPNAVAVGSKWRPLTSRRKLDPRARRTRIPGCFRPDVEGWEEAWAAFEQNGHVLRAPTDHSKETHVFMAQRDPCADCPALSGQSDGETDEDRVPIIVEYPDVEAADRARPRLKNFSNAKCMSQLCKQIVEVATSDLLPVNTQPKTKPVNELSLGPLRNSKLPVIVPLMGTCGRGSEHQQLTSRWALEA